MDKVVKYNVYKWLLQLRNSWLRCLMRPRVLFILKRRQDYSTDLANFNRATVATGMYNSAKFVSDMLVKRGIESKVEVVIDNNDIDREIAAFKPTHVMIEGIWVVPEKFKVLKKLHPKVKWIVRCHSEIPFLANEGNALEWILEYVKLGVKVAGNSKRVTADLRTLVAEAYDWGTNDINSKTPHLPNYYPLTAEHCNLPVFFGDSRSEWIDVGCFGALRPLKNQLAQAVAAVEFARQRGKRLRFHINQGRIEGRGDNVLKNLQALFAKLERHQLVEHPWTDHESFKKLIGEMDLCMQVSFSETFNIVSADAVLVGAPIVVSAEVAWAHPTFADPNSTRSIVETMDKVWKNRGFYVTENRSHLYRYSCAAADQWVEYLT